jgi:hypothetical protein
METNTDEQWRDCAADGYPPAEPGGFSEPVLVLMAGGGMRVDAYYRHLAKDERPGRKGYWRVAAMTAGTHWRPLPKPPV